MTLTLIPIFMRREKILYMISSFFFFFKQKTAYEMRISDWSSDVCSSDLTNPGNETIKRGNPDLQPFRAWQAEIGAEWYFASDSLLNVAAFYKKIDSFVTQITTPQTVDEITFQVTVPGNGDGVTVKGFEVGYRQSFANWQIGRAHG